MKQRFLKAIPMAQVTKLAALLPDEQGVDDKGYLLLADGVPARVVLLALETGECATDHAPKGDTLIQLLQGRAYVLVGGIRHDVRSGEAIALPAGVPHRIEAPEACKLLFTVVCPPEGCGEMSNMKERLDQC